MKRVAFLIGCLMASFFAFSTDYERFEVNGKVGLRDDAGNVVLPADFDALGWSDGNFSVIGKITGYRRKGQWGLLNLNKEFITPAEFASLTWPGGDRVIASKSINFYTKFGCLDLFGKTVIPYDYDEIEISGLRAIVMIKRGIRYEYGLIDLANRQVLPVSFQKVTPIGSLRYAVRDFNNKTALCTEEGKWITGFVIDEISDFTHDFAIINNGWKKGVINRNGDIIVEPSFREIRVTGPESVEGRRAAEWKMIDPQYKTLQTVEADDIAFGLNDWIRITIAGKMGFIDERFQSRWIPTYDFIGPATGNIIPAKKGKKWGLLNREQREVLPFEFDSLCVAGNVVRAARKTSGKITWSLYDTVGVKKTGKDYDRLENSTGKFFPAMSRGYWGIVDRYGKETVACVYDSLLQIKDGLVSVRFKQQYGIVTTDDQWRVMPQPFGITLMDADHYIEKQDSIFFLKDFTGNSIYFTTNPITVFSDHLLERLPDGLEKEINLQGQLIKRQEPIALPSLTELTFRESEGLVGIKRDGKFGFVDSRGRLRIANRYDNIGEFHDGLAPVSLLGKWGFINQHDQIVIQPNFDTTGNFDEGVSLVSRKGKYGLIDKDGNTLLDLRYDSIQKLSNGNFVIIQQSMKGLTDNRGRVLIEPRFDTIKPVDENLVIVARGGMFGVLTREGLSVFPLQFETLTYIPQKKLFVAKQESRWETITLHK
jgi:hypothetical protein